MPPGATVYQAGDTFYAGVRDTVISFLVFLGCSIVAYRLVQQYRWRPQRLRSLDDAADPKLTYTTNGQGTLAPVLGRTTYPVKRESGGRLNEGAEESRRRHGSSRVPTPAETRMAMLLGDMDTVDSGTAAEAPSAHQLVGRRGGPIRGLNRALHAGREPDRRAQNARRSHSRSLRALVGSLSIMVMDDDNESDEDGSEMERRGRNARSRNSQDRLVNWAAGMGRRRHTADAKGDADAGDDDGDDDDDDDDDSLEALLPRLLCVLALAAALLNLLWLPVTVLAEGLTEWTSDRDYWSWLSFSLLYTVHRHAIYAANVAVYALLPIAFFYSEAAQGVGMGGGLGASLREAVTLWLLVATLAAGGVYVIVSLLGARGLDGWLGVLDGWMAVVCGLASVRAVPRGSLNIFSWIRKLSMHPWHQRGISDQLVTIGFEEAAWRRRLSAAVTAYSANAASLPAGRPLSARRTGEAVLRLSPATAGALRPRRASAGALAIDTSIAQAHHVPNVFRPHSSDDLLMRTGLAPQSTMLRTQQDIEEEEAWAAILERRRQQRQRHRSVSDTDLTKHQRDKVVRSQLRLVAGDALAAALAAGIERNSDWLPAWSRSIANSLSSASSSPATPAAAEDNASLFSASTDVSGFSATQQSKPRSRPALLASTFFAPFGTGETQRPRSSSDIEHRMHAALADRAPLSPRLAADRPLSSSSSPTTLSAAMTKTALASATRPYAPFHTKAAGGLPLSGITRSAGTPLTSLPVPAIVTSPPPPPPPPLTARSPGTRPAHAVASERSEMMIAQHRLQYLAKERRMAERTLSTSPLWRNISFILLMAGTGVGWLLLQLRVALSLVRGLVALAVPVTGTALDSLLLLHWLPSSSAGTLLRIGLVIYFCICMLVGVYDTTTMRRIRPRPGRTTAKVMVANIAILVVLAAGLPMLAAVLGLSDTASLAEAADRVVASAHAAAMPPAPPPLPPSPPLSPPVQSLAAVLLSYLQHPLSLLSPAHLLHAIAALWAWLRSTWIWLVYPAPAASPVPLPQSLIPPPPAPVPPAPLPGFWSSPGSYLLRSATALLPLAWRSEGEAESTWWFSSPQAADAWTQGGRAVVAGLPDFGSWGVWLSTVYRTVMFVSVSYVLLERTVLSSLRAG
ncbi:hypothetical protein THASP1DRAFT_29835 [Thamnocephalis sphaerospora]|uniref:Uncharacterized protein n=1 Tax=Thamnocephalis sphaerospora TaxID=78915 RepID=A0A4P9XQP4_9FUNG|nr:hypothetical protein THASP1DRAFT_29835 [Thamnocephalis sphaerospora]|eukprot:RKP08358.1 hypothetical protein THASP1DRAFT_29835 [Thamnocephalis sphaerospora]